jgi:putative nucleotidyltransferase with HDIG domain
MFDRPADPAAPSWEDVLEAEGFGPRLIQRLKRTEHLLRRLRAHHAPTVAHSLRVAHVLSAMTALDPRPMTDRATIAIIGALHDIGKLAVPVEILGSERRLSAAELASMREHPAAGAAILRDEGFPPLIIAATRDHHERWAGGGYPSGRPAAEMHPLSRALAVADSFVAMVEPGRTYRRALSLPGAIAELVACSGTQFDPAAVALLRGVLDTEPKVLLAAAGL